MQREWISQYAAHHGQRGHVHRHAFPWTGGGMAVGLCELAQPQQRRSRRTWADIRIIQRVQLWAPKMPNQLHESEQLFCVVRTAYIGITI
jgi:hypothetical protein